MLNYDKNMSQKIKGNRKENGGTVMQLIKLEWPKLYTLYFSMFRYTFKML